MSIVGDVEIGVAVAIQVGPSHAHAVVIRAANARLSAGVDIGPVAFVAVEQVRLSLGAARATGRGYAVVLAPAVVKGRPPALIGYVVGDVEVEIAIAVVVGKGRADPPACRAKARGRRDVFEGRVCLCLVGQKRVPAPPSEVEVRVAVAIVVAKGHAHIPAAQPHARAGGRIAKRAVPYPAIERGACGRVRADAAGEKEVELAIAVVVPKAAASRLGFDDVLLVGPAGFIDKGDASGLGHIGKKRPRTGDGQRASKEQQSWEVAGRGVHGDSSRR